MQDLNSIQRENKAADEKRRIQIDKVAQALFAHDWPYTTYGTDWTAADETEKEQYREDASIAIRAYESES